MTHELDVESSGCGMWEAAADVNAWNESTIESCSENKDVIIQKP